MPNVCAEIKCSQMSSKSVLEHMNKARGQRGLELYIAIKPTDSDMPKEKCMSEYARLQGEASARSARASPAHEMRGGVLLKAAPDAENAMRVDFDASPSTLMPTRTPHWSPYPWHPSFLDMYSCTMRELEERKVKQRRLQVLLEHTTRVVDPAFPATSSTCDNLNWLPPARSPS